MDPAQYVKIYSIRGEVTELAIPDAKRTVADHPEEWAMSRWITDGGRPPVPEDQWRAEQRQRRR